MRCLIESLLAVSWNREREIKGFSMRGTVIRIIKRTKAVASALALFVLFLVPWHGWSSAVANDNVTYPVIFIHGIFSDASAWDSIKGKLGPLGWGWTSQTVRSDQTVLQADFYTLNFSDNHNLSFDQQGTELYNIIKKVKTANKAQKVILVGHSMGGLAAREYLQGFARGADGHFTPYGGDVERLVTIGTPHLGTLAAVKFQDTCTSDITWKICEIVGEIRERPWDSIAVTELRPESYAFQILNNFFYSPPPRDVTYTSIIGKVSVNKTSNGDDCVVAKPLLLLPNDNDYGDGIVQESSQDFGGVPFGGGLSLDRKSVTIAIDCSDEFLYKKFPEAHTLETSNSDVWAVLSKILAGYKKTQSPPPPTLSPPTNFQAPVNGSFIDASWNHVPGAAGYRAYYGTSPNVHNTGPIELGYVTSARIAIPSGVSGIFYAVLRAYSGSVESGDSNEVPISIVAVSPTISSVSPNPVTGVALPGRVNMTLYGSNFVSGLSVTLTWTAAGGGTATLSSANTTFVSAMQVNISVATDVTPDNWTVKVTNPDGKVSNIAGFAVVAPTTAAPAPTISSVIPNPVTGSDSTQPFVINGANFVSGVNVTLRDLRTGQTFPNRTVNSLSSTQIVINPNFTNNTATWSVEVINPDGKSSGQYQFQVVAAATPLVVNGIASSYTATSGTYQPTIFLSGSGFSSIVNQIYFTCSKNGISCAGSPYVWTSANWSGKFIVYSDSSAVIAPVLTVSSDPAGTYNWSVTFSGGGQSVIKYFTVTK